MSFERIFESRSRRVVMVGLFLALLELIRDGLVWAEQPRAGDSVYLRSLTDEPAEQAVQKAILASAGENQAANSKPDREPPIPISELPPKTEPAVSVEPAQTNETPIPITELPSLSEPTTPAQERERTEPSRQEPQQ